MFGMLTGLNKNELGLGGFSGFDFNPCSSNVPVARTNHFIP